MNNLAFRIAGLEDTHKINDLVNSAYRGEFSKQGWTTEADLLGGQRSDLAEIEEIIASPKQVILLCLNNEEIIGTVAIEKKDDQQAYIGMLTIRSDLQAGGLGKKLLAAAEEYVQNEWYCNQIQMYVLKQRIELISWYIRRGYKPTGTFEPFPYGDLSFGEPKIADLEFMVLQKDFRV